ncbi:MAG: hypothetical protein EPN71_16930 [Rhodanobacter sp.]|nr:MAG: hypothetical protein EPN71_16930 [Rhodanobacter sp.]
MAGAGDAGLARSAIVEVEPSRHQRTAAGFTDRHGVDMLPLAMDAALDDPRATLAKFLSVPL